MRINKGMIRTGAYILLGVILFLIILKYDLAISLIINSWRSPGLDIFMLLIEKMSIGIIIVVPLALLLFNKEFRNIKNWTVSFLGAYALTLLVKVLIARERPFNFGLNVPTDLIDPKYSTWDSSFPSNHASTALASFFFIPSGILRLSWIGICALIMFSRVYFGLHYLSDVIAGAAIGLGVSYLISKHANKLLEIKALNKFKYRRARKKNK
ncbi:MAG: phosphatase PAP2 family protein [Nanoarchaeota archaeon]|nr:phosphatase PAP2 family protein [Nanoarchaeota archaeon]